MGDLWFQVDLEPNGRLHIIIELDGVASEGEKMMMKLTHFDTSIQSRLSISVDDIYTVSQKKLCKIVFVRISSNFHQF